MTLAALLQLGRITTAATGSNSTGGSSASASCRGGSHRGAGLVEVRQFLYDEIGLKNLFTGSGRTATELPRARAAVQRIYGGLGAEGAEDAKEEENKGGCGVAEGGEGGVLEYLAANTLLADIPGCVVVDLDVR